MNPIAIIGGTGLGELPGLVVDEAVAVDTPYGQPSAWPRRGHIRDLPVVFLPRHGQGHTIAPHRINYRANIHALHALAAGYIIAIGAVGGIHADIGPGRLVIPDQLIDYTYNRGHTFYDEPGEGVEHIDFTRPYCESLRADLLRAGREVGLDMLAGGTYAATQGPRLETAAEIDRLERDGCDVVGMTGMPEAALARELGICYAGCAVCANRAAGRGAEISMADIRSVLQGGMRDVETLLTTVLPLLG